MCKPVSVTVGHLLAHPQFFVKNIQLCIKNDGLHGIQSCGHSDAVIFIACLAHPVNSARTHDTCLIIIIRKDSPTITIATKGFGREKTGACHAGQGTHPGAIPGGTETLRGIIYDPQSFGCREGIDRIIIHRLSEQSDADNAHNPDIVGAAGRQGSRKACRVKIEGFGIDFSKDRNGTQYGHDFGTGGKGKGRNYDAFPRLQPLGQQCQNQRIGSR